MLEQSEEALARPDVDVQMRKSPGALGQAAQIPCRVAWRSEELAAHVVVDAVHFVSAAVEVPDGLRTNQPATTGDQDFHSLRWVKAYLVGWHRHVVLTATAYTWLQDTRRGAGARVPTLRVARAVITEILTAHFCDATALRRSAEPDAGWRWFATSRAAR
jgi:hypothetical protein